MLHENESFHKYINNNNNNNNNNFHDKEILLQELIEKFKNPLFKFCFYLAKNNYEAEDLFQETWVKVCKNISCFDSQKNFQTWLYTITINIYKDKYKKSKRWLNKIVDFFSTDAKEDEMNKVKALDYIPEKSLFEKEEKENLKKAVSMLDDTFRIPIILFYFKGLSYSNISQILDIPIGTVKSRLNLAKKKLKQVLENDSYGGA